MSKISFKVDISAKKAYGLVKDNENADLVHEEMNCVGEDKYIGILIFEKYYMRSSNRAGLIVIFDNTKGETEVRAIATASSQGMIFNFDWGAADSFIRNIWNILEEYII